MKKGWFFSLSIIAVVILSGCESLGNKLSMENSSQNELQDKTTKKVKIDKNSIQPASVDNMTLQVLADGNDETAGIVFKVIARNTSQTKIEISMNKFVLNKSHADEAIDIDVPVKKKEKKILNPGESVTFGKLLGPVTPDTPGYYYLTAKYDKKEFWTQMPALEDFR